MTPRLPQQEVKVIVGKKNRSHKIRLWVCFSAIGGGLFLGGVLAWDVIHPLPFHLINDAKQVNPTEPAKQVNQNRKTNIESIDSSKAPETTRIGVADATIQSLFEQPDIGFTFETASPVNGEPRMIGASAHGLATIELIGPPTNLTRAAIKVNIPDDDTHALALNAEYVLRFIQNAAPQWTGGGGDWVIQNLDAFASGQQTAVKTIQAGKEISMTLIGEQEFLAITVKANQSRNSLRVPKP